MSVPVDLMSRIRSRRASSGAKITSAVPANAVWRDRPSINKSRFAGSSLGLPTTRASRPHATFRAGRTTSAPGGLASRIPIRPARRGTVILQVEFAGASPSVQATLDNRLHTTPDVSPALSAAMDRAISRLSSSDTKITSARVVHGPIQVSHAPRIRRPACERPVRPTIHNRHSTRAVS